jgi:tRNA(adenine34) deaminase
LEQTPDTFMREALGEAKKALALGEVPVGAIIERNGEIIGRGHNRTESEKDPTGHAEIIAIRAAAEAIGGWRLLGCNLYVTTEPCAMCSGAIVLARIERMYIGTMDPKAGACGSLMNIPQDHRLNHYVDIQTGILEEECRELMKDFFKGLRQQKMTQRQINQEE